MADAPKHPSKPKARRFVLRPYRRVPTQRVLYHLMLMGLKAPLKAGSSFPLKLKFEKAGEVTVEVTVLPPGVDNMPTGMKH